MSIVGPAFARDIAEDLNLDFSEASLQTIDDALIILTQDPTSEAAKNLLRLCTTGALPPAESQALLIWRCFYYMLEVACRNLGGKWVSRKRFLRGAQEGVEFPSRGIFVSAEEVRKGLVTKQYRELKARVLGAPINQVELSTAKPPPV